MLYLHLRELRTKRNLSIRKLSTLSGISKSYLSKIEKGDTKNVSAKTVYKLALALKVMPCRLVNKNHSCLRFLVPTKWQSQSKKIEVKFLKIMRKNETVIDQFMERLIILTDEFVEK